MPEQQETICTDCQHFLHDYLGLASGPRCAANRDNFVYNGILGFKPCGDVNLTGSCAQFKAKPVQAPKRPWYKRWFGL